MERRQCEQVIARGARVVLTAVFAYAGIAKAIDPATFASQLSGYRLLPGALLTPVAYLLPMLEIACVTGLWIRSARPVAAILLAGLLAVFIAALLIAWARGLDITCGCFGTDEPGIDYPLTLLRNIALLALAIACAALPRQQK